MMKWFKLAKFFVTAPGWVKGLIIAGLILLLPVSILLLPLIAILGVVVLVVLGVVALIVSPARSLLHRIH